MATLDQLRAFFPTAESDSDVIKMASKQFGIDPVEIANEVGFSFNKPGLMSDVKRGTGQVISAIGSTARDLGLPNAGRAVENYGEDITYRNPSQINTVGEAIRSPLTTIRESVGEIVPQIGTSIGAGMAGRFVGGAIGSLAGPAGTVAGQAIGGAAGAYLGNLAQSYGGIRSEQREQGIEDKGRAFATGAASAGLDTAFGAERVVNKFLTKGSDILAREAGTSLAKQVGKQAAIGFGTEALTETGQTALERYGALKPLTGDEALNEYGLAAIKGGIGGGVVRGALTSIAGERTPTGGNDIQQAFSQPEVSGTPINNVAPPAAPLVATPESVETSAPVPPAVTGGTTDIAQAQQQTQLDIQAAQIEEQKIQQAQAVQAQREETAAYFGAEPAMENGKLVGGTIFGKSFADPEKFNAELDKLAQNEAPKTPVRRAVEKAYMDSLPPEKRKLAAIQSGALQFWANKPDIAAAAASINTAMSDLVAKGKGIDDPKVTQFAQMYEALTGTEAPAYEAATKVKPKETKGAKDGKLQLQTTTGLGAVPVEGGAGEATEGVAGAVQPSGVQPIGAGSVAEGSLGLQVGQPSGEGIRTGTGGVSDVDGINAPSQVTAKPSPETNQLLRQIFGDAYAIDEKVPPVSVGPATRVAGKAGQVYVQPSQAGQSGLPESVPAGMGGERVVKRKRRWNAADSAPVPGTNQYYSTAVEHIHPTKRSEILQALYYAALAPQTTRGDELSGIVRAQILQMSLNEQMTSPQISAHFASLDIPQDISAGTIDTQRRRMGIVDGGASRGLYINTNSEVGKQLMQDLVTAAANFKTDAFPDGIGPDQLRGFYAAKNSFATGDEVVELSDEAFEEPVGRTTDVKLQEELYKSKDEDKDTQSMGQIATAGGSQGNVDSLKQTRKDKKTGKVYKDISALAQIEELTNEAETIRESLMDMAPKDPRREGLIARLEAIGDVDSGEIANLFQEYNKAQQLRSKEAEEAGVVKKQEAEPTKEELTGEELAASEREDERRKDAEEKAKADQEGEDNAVQKSSAEEVPVREGAGDGKAVGKGNAKRSKAARKAEAKPEPKQEAKPEEIKTPAEEWADVSKLAPELPPYDVLKKDEKSRWDDLVRRGQANLAAAVKIIGEVTQPAGPALADNQTKAEGADGTVAPVNSKGDKFLEFTDLEDTVSGVSDVREQFADMDIEHALDFVSDWETVNDPSPDSFHGQLKTENGRYIGVLNLAHMSNPGYAAETTRHEIAHAVDMTPHGGVYSHQQEMNVEIVNGKVVPVGEVAKELFALYKNDAAFTKLLDYPFNLKLYPELKTNGQVESEMFAQVFAVYTNPAYTDYITTAAPKTAAFFKEVINDISTTTPLQIQKNTTAATRALDFRSRYTSRRNQRESTVYGRSEQTTQGPSNRRGQGQAFTADQVISALPKPLQASARSQWTNIKTLAKRGMYASAITEDVISMAKKYMPSAAKYLQAQYARQGTRLEFEKRIEDILSAFDKLPANLKGEGKGSVNEYIHDSTREKKWGYYPGEQQIGTKLFEVDPDFKERFDKIEAQSPAAAQLIKDVFRHGHEALRLKQSAAENAVNREFDSRIKAAGNDADLLQSLNKEKRQMLKRITSLRNVNVSDPYAYLGRYGDYVVVAKSKEFIAYEEAATGTRSSARGDSIIGDPQQAKNWLQENVSNPLHYVVQFAETQGEADDIAAELQATGNYDVQPEDAGIKEANASYIGGSDVHLAVARLRNLAQRQSESTDGRLDKAISDLYLMTVAEASARRSELERKNVSGADKNMMRNLATSGRADAHFLATMEHSDELNDALESMRDEARRNRKDAMPLYNELYTRYADSMEYDQPSVLAQNLLRMSTLWNLSTSPAYYLQQVLQTSVLSLPYMAGRLGYFRSARAIKRAYNDTADLVAGLDINDHIDFNRAPPDVRFMLRELVRMGKIDIGIDADAKARTDEQGVLGKVMFKLQGVNTRIEAINRATAAIAAYRGYMDRYKGATGADGVRFAAEVVSNTHGNYDGFNTPRILQSGGAKVLLQFKRFQIIQLSMLAKLIHTSFKGASAEERAVAFASLKFITAHMAVLGGALGVPFVSQAASILSSIFGDEDEPDDYEYKLRRMIGNDAVADLLLRGVPAAVGLESLGKRLSMENVASPFGPFVEFNLTSRADAAQMITGMMGPTVGLGLKFVDALGMMSKGNYYKGLELALPNGMGNAMKSYRFATEGITMRNGDLVMKPEEISMIDAAFQAVGLPTTTITDRQYTQKVVAEFDKFYAQRAGEIKAMYVEGSRASDPAAMAEARDDWQKLQESRVKNGYKRQSMSELFRAPVEARKRERGVVGGVETTKSNRRFVEQQVNQ